MKILLYGLNYAPELTGIGRYTGEMGPWLKGQGADVRVVTTPPYYPQWKIADGYRKFWFGKEEVEGVPVWRCPFYVPAKPTTVTRLLHLGSFAAVSFVALWRHAFWRPDVVFMVEPASMTLPGGLVFAKLVGAKTWLHVQDFEMEAMLGLSKELAVGRGQLAGEESRVQSSECRVQNEERKVASGSLKKKVLGTAAGLEGWLKRRCDRVSSISKVMMTKLGARGIPEERISFFPNWVDIDFMSPGQPQRDFRKEWGIPEESCFVLYSGNIGRKQGLEMVLEVARRLDERIQSPESRDQTSELRTPNSEFETHHFSFVLVGEGAAKEELQAEAEERGLKNIQFHSLQPYEDLPDLLRSADVHLVIQKKGAADAVLPSKLTSILAVGGEAVITAEEETELGRLGREYPGMVTILPPEEPAALERVLKDGRERFVSRTTNQKARRYAEENLERDAVLGRVLAEMRAMVS